LRFQISRPIGFFGAAFFHAKQRAHLTSGASRDVNESEKLICRAPLKPFSDVVGNRERGAIQLILEAASATEILILEQLLR